MNEMDHRPSRPVSGQVLPNQRPAEVSSGDERAKGAARVCADGRAGAGLRGDAGGVRRAGGSYRWWTTSELKRIEGMTVREAMAATGRGLGSIKKAARSYGITLADGRALKRRPEAQRERVIRMWKVSGSRILAADFAGVPLGTAKGWISAEKRCHGAA